GAAGFRSEKPGESCSDLARRGREPARDLATRLQSRFHHLAGCCARGIVEGVARLPSGTVTLLFTDIEGSTRLLMALGEERYASVLAEHRALVRRALAAHDGHEVDTEGDSFFAAFASPADAVAAAAEVQR